MNDLASQFNVILPLATEWVEAQEALILKTGEPLSEQGMANAKLMGVANPEKIRLLKVSAISLPDNPILIQAARMTNLISPYTAGLTVRYGIFVRQDHWTDRRLVAHECVHTAQYERLGGISQFLMSYLKECIEIGYPNGPLEQEAIRLSSKIS